MKVTKLFLTAAIALSLGLTACSNDDDISSGGEKEGNTNVSVTLKMSQNSGLRQQKLCLKITTISGGNGLEKTI